MSAFKTPDIKLRLEKNWQTLHKVISYSLRRGYLFFST